MTAPGNRWAQRWERLPREARDTLFQLAVITWTAGPHFTHLPPWCTGLTLLLLAWRARIALTHGGLPRRAWVVALLALATGLTLWSERTLLGKDAGVTLLVVLLALKTLEQRARRDALVVFFLGFFLTLTHCLYSQSMFTALSMLVSTWGLLTAQVLSSMPVGLPSLRRAGATAARVALLGVPLMVLLFVLFPRFGPCGGCRRMAWATPGCRARCAWAAWPSWPATKPSRFGFDSREPSLRSRRCTSAVRCLPDSTESSGASRRRAWPRVAMNWGWCADLARRCATR
jgi:hypothetical protein